MAFLTPFILSGLALAAIPVIIHLLNRRRVQVVNWAAMRFLHDVVAQRRRQIRPEDLLLMLLRMLILAAIVLALAQPMLKSAGFVGAEARQDVVLVLDATASTSLPQGQERRFDRETKIAAYLLEQLKPGDTASLLLAAQSPVWLTPRPVVITPTSLVELRNLLAQSKPLAGGTDFIRVLDAAALRLAEGRHPHRQILVLSDGAAGGWHAGELRRWQFLRKTLHESQPVPPVGVLAVAGPPKDFVNLSILEVKLDRRAVGVRRSAKSAVVIRNTGPLSSGARMVHFAVDGQEPTSLPLANLEPGEETTLETPVTFNRPGTSLLTVECPADEPITLDNHYDLAVEVLDRLPVLVVDGAPSGRRQDCESFYVSAALNPARKPASQPGQPAAISAEEQSLGLVADVKVVPVPQLPQTDLSAYAAVLVLNPPALPAEVIGKLRNFVERGGGVLFAPGSQTDPAWINAKLLDAAGGILPARFLERSGKSAAPGAVVGPQGLLTSQAEHPSVTVAMDPGKSDVDQAKVFEHWKLGEPSPRDESRRVILRLADKSPLAVLGVVGQGRVLQLSVPLDMDWTNWPAKRFFPVLLNEMVSYLAEPQVYQRHLSAGMPLMASFPSTRFPPGMFATLTDPLGRASDVTGETDGARTVFRAGTAGLAGVYTLRLGKTPAPDETNQKPNGTSAVTVLFTVAPNAGESELKWLDQQERETLTKEAGLTFFDGTDQAASNLAINHPGTELAAWLLAGVLGLLVMEILFTRWLAGRRNEMPISAGVNA